MNPRHTPIDAPVNILLVDDEPANLLSLTALLEPLGQRLVQANSGAEALRHVLDQDFAVILLDVRMPGMDGIETASLIRARKRSQATPIIFLTGMDSAPDRVFQGYSAGAVDYLTKPVVPVILRAKVEAFIELERARARLRAEVQERERAASELAALNRLLEERNRQLADANAELDAFCGAVSHDLRAPLAHVEGFLELLEISAKDKLGTKEREYVHVMRDTTQRMRQLISDFLHFARMGTSDVQAGMVDMDAVVAEALEDLGPMPEGREIRLDIAPLPPARGDARLLKQVWINLLSNAVKYSNMRDPAVVEVRGEIEAQRVVYRVRDNGIGFDMARAERLFSAFFRLHTPGQFEGVGIGLALVKRLVERHGGHVGAQSAPGQGATFWFALPR
ncbi:MAG TPA: ATP-binding protein [Burkholderiaceae bacterium]|nr:ATP-binding protein [Burkholderiaceae bacterium]